jgi:hypothetical protein
MALKKKPKLPRLCPQGKTYTDSLGFKDKNGNYVSYLGYTARIEIRKETPVLGESTPGDADVLITLTTENGYITVGETFVTISIPASVTATFPVDTYVWELELFSPDATPFVPYLMQPSNFKVIQESTLNE